MPRTSSFQDKYAATVASRHLPIEVEMEQRFHHHSIFCCPVSREPSSLTNPPMLLPCGHVISACSLDKVGPCILSYGNRHY